jgi:ribosomal protein S18 acetylase RimI-like enzyme
MTISIRDASSDDRAAAIALWQECGLTRPWNDPVSDFDRALAFPGSTILLADDSGTVVGTATVGFDGHRGWIYYLGVKPSRRGEGIGRRLIDTCADWLRDRDCPKVELMLREGNPASGLYERLGWELQPVRVYARWLQDSE